MGDYHANATDVIRINELEAEVKRLETDVIILIDKLQSAVVKGHYRGMEAAMKVFDGLDEQLMMSPNSVRRRLRAAAKEQTNGS